MGLERRANAVIDKRGLNSILAKLSIGKNLKDYDKDYVLYYLQSMNLNYTDAYGIINGANRLFNLRKKNENEQFNLVSLVNDLLSETNIRSFKLMDQMGARISSAYHNKGIVTEEVDNTIKEMLKSIKAATGLVDEQILQVTNEEVELLYALSCIYNVVSSYTVEKGIEGGDIEQVAKNIVLNKFMKLKDILSSLTVARAKELKDLFKSMTSKDEFVNEYNVFDPSEIADLMNKTTSLLRDLTAYKFRAVRSALNEYLKSLESLVVTDEEKSLLAKTTAKSIMLKVGSILSEQGDNVRLATGLLSGNSFAEVFGQELEQKDSERDSFCLKLQSAFPDVRVQGMNVKNQLALLNDSGTLLKRVTASYAYTLVGNVTRAVYNALDLPEETNIIKKKVAIENLGFSVDNMLHVDNFTDLFINTYFSKPQNCENFEKNIRFMLKITRLENVQNIFTHNFTILAQDSAKLQNDIYTIAQKYYGDVDKIREEVNKYLNLRVGQSRSNSSEKEVKRTTNRRVGFERAVIDIDINTSAIYSGPTRKKADTTKSSGKRASKKSVEQQEDNMVDVSTADVDEIVEDLGKLNDKVTYAEIEKEFFLIREALLGVYDYVDAINTDEENNQKNQLRQVFASTPNNSLAKTIYGIMLNNMNPATVSRNISLFVKKLNNYEGDLIYLKNTFDTSIIEEIMLVIDFLKEKNQTLEKETEDFYVEEHRNKASRDKMHREFEEFERVTQDAMARARDNSLLSNLLNEDAILSAYLKKDEFDKFGKQRQQMPAKLKRIEANNLSIKSLTKINNALAEVLDGIESDQEIVWVDVEEPVRNTKEIEAKIANLKELIALKEKRLNQYYAGHIEHADKNVMGKKILAQISELEKQVKELENQLSNMKGNTI